ncbi:MAG: 30S ribosomal protein S13 [Candidatus Andersenbacteria bacterium RIFCSPHIGHO2_02_FULL_45_11]|uniref:Small ribosomal subunit protein uS13 n=1 Tax=Candidatus Andersenbacteria bacterium RIFCSPHIGHO2_12_FULL_45_11 TaxID=1797281 RepID=A0A1G1X2A4_9BACT|nr:MAG: 30S ribosomal protein S13 [Candidatus Andersenbacteria bacterium RIFCSPHIGHO2_01_FULL_46_36]OGY34000.1 MAG: 30S ribosomal protein S13 [Candidatus Andersenbacteria bacterium RIFCSPHIGHO2_02_FULL_45_11]OGY34146.1 MAG: 30S ribosomal protein S13 [Candidatus Andersenbacteria bacterium RIFCSPHIGHO2_12_FULL_45_11]QBM02265.1 30S ribosomal protein S13 [uncultured archaeon]
MPIRISGVTLQDKKHILYAITDIYGIGRPMAAKILQEIGISPEIFARDLTEKEQNTLREYIEKNIRVEGELRRETSMNIKHHRDIGTYRGLRHAKHLPVRGQRTRTNSRTVRGNVRKTAGSGRKSSDQKT